MIPNPSPRLYAWIIGVVMVLAMAWEWYRAGRSRFTEED